jgi:hypothetical protein
VVGQAFGDAEDCPLESQGSNQFQGAGVALIGLGRVLVVDHGPKALEGPLGGEAGHEAGDDANRSKEDLQGARLPRAGGGKRPC